MSMMDTYRIRSGPMNPAGMQPASFEAWQALVAPGDVFRHPREVLTHPQLSREDKRAILASLASDASAMENPPGLRCLTGSRAEPVPVDAVLATLAQLDDESATPASRERNKRPRRLAKLYRHFRSRRKDDDDDPPPCPAAATPRPWKPSGTAALAVGIAA